MAIVLYLNAACLNKLQPFCFFTQEDLESRNCIDQRLFLFFFFVNNCGLSVGPSLQSLLHRRAGGGHFSGAIFQKGGRSAVPGSQTHVDTPSLL